MKNKKYLIIIIPFLLIITSFPLIKIFQEDEEKSLIEARALQQRSEINFQDIGKGLGQLEDYLVDQFPARSNFLRIRSQIDKALSKRSARDAYISQDSWLFLEDHPQNFEGLGQMMEVFLDNYKNKKVYYAICPVKSYVFPEKYSFVGNNLAESNLRILKDNIDRLEGDNFHIIDLTKEFRYLDEREELWYRTDFHWNPKGAKLAVDMILDEMLDRGDISKLEKEGYFIYKTLDKPYGGDLNRRFSYIYGWEDPIYFNYKNRDNLSYYLSQENQEDIEVEREKIIGSGLDKDILGYEDLYTENLAYYKILNPSALNEKKLLILKDSMQNPTSEIFAHFFSQVSIVDARARQNYKFSQLAEEADIILFIFNSNNPIPDTVDYVLDSLS